MSRASTILTVAGLCASLPGIAGAQCLDQYLTASDKGVSDKFGNSIAMAGDLAIVGAYADDNERGSGAGAGYIFRKQNGSWAQTGKLLGPSQYENKQVGRVVGTDGTYVVLGAAGGPLVDAHYAGKAFTWVWWNNGFVSLGQLDAGQVGGDDFGRAVAIDSGVAVVGAPFDDNGIGVDAGSAHIFRYMNDGSWDHNGAVQLGRAGDLLGTSVAMDGYTIVVGAPFWDYDGQFNDYEDAGKVYVIGPSGNGWDLRDSFNDVGVETGAHFGYTVDIDGDYIVVGSPHGDSDPGQDVGGVTVVKKVNGDWQIDTTLWIPDMVAGMNFGSAVAIHGGRIAVAAGGVDKVFIYELHESGAWVYNGIYTGGTNAWGVDVDLDGDELFVGDTLDDPDNVADAGAVTVFPFDADNGNNNYWNATPIPAPSVHDGCTEHATNDGSASCGSSSNAPDVWYQVTPDATGTVVLDTEGSSYDTVLSVLDDIPAYNGTELACDDDSGTGNASRIVMTMNSGQTYVIRVSGYNGAKGAFTLRLTETCRADMNSDGALNVFDFLAFQTAFSNGDPAADFDGSGALNVFDFLAYQTAFGNGC